MLPELLPRASVLLTQQEVTRDELRIDDALRKKLEQQGRHAPPCRVPDVTGMMLMGEVHCVTHSPCVFGAEKKYSENPRWNFP